MPDSGFRRKAPPFPGHRGAAFSREEVLLTGGCYQFSMGPCKARGAPQLPEAHRERLCLTYHAAVCLSVCIAMLMHASSWLDSSTWLDTPLHSQLSTNCTCNWRWEDCFVPIWRPAAMMGRPCRDLRAASVRTILLNLQSGKPFANSMQSSDHRMLSWRCALTGASNSVCLAARCCMRKNAVSVAWLASAQSWRPDRSSPAVHLQVDMAGGRLPQARPESQQSHSLPWPRQSGVQQNQAAQLICGRCTSFQA